MTPVEEITQNVTARHVKGLSQNGLDAIFIADALNLPIKEVEKIIKEVKPKSI